MRVKNKTKSFWEEEKKNGFRHFLVRLSFILVKLFFYLLIFFFFFPKGITNLKKLYRDALIYNKLHIESSYIRYKVHII